VWTSEWQSVAVPAALCFFAYGGVIAIFAI